MIWRPAGPRSVSTSRTPLHRSRSGELVPGTMVDAEELYAIAEAMEALIDGSLTDAQAELLRSVVDQAAPKPDPSVPLSVLQKQLDLIAKSL